MPVFDVENAKVAVVGLGYVGLPLAVEFGKQVDTIGFDINTARIAELQQGVDNTQEVSAEEMAEATRIQYTESVEAISQCNVYIVTVPTPIDNFKTPDLTPLRKASEMLGPILKPNDVVVYESTVYPGATEEVCVPILEKLSGMVYNRDFYAGYSPERINPGDKEHRVSNIKKVTAGSTPEVADYVDALYGKIIIAGTHKASSIRVAEAAKVIENTQRDVNIALINELSLIFHRLGIDTLEVLEAAGTKWNFLPFRPGLVGGHCIGVDPYYLTHKAQEIGYHPKIILAGREINDGMGSYVAEQVMKLLTRNRIHVVGSNILMLGFTFKENCPDLRNTRAIDIVKELQQYNAVVDVYDPWASSEEAQAEYGIELVDKPAQGKYDAIILTVAHDEFKAWGADEIRRFGRDQHILYDVKSMVNKDDVDGRL